jgi:hypothetical protein
VQSYICIFYGQHLGDAKATGKKGFVCNLPTIELKSKKLLCIQVSVAWSAAVGADQLAKNCATKKAP